MLPCIVHCTMRPASGSVGRPGNPVRNGAVQQCDSMSRELTTSISAKKIPSPNWTVSITDTVCACVRSLVRQPCVSTLNHSIPVGEQQAEERDDPDGDGGPGATQLPAAVQGHGRLQNRQSAENPGRLRACGGTRHPDQVGHSPEF